MLTPGQTVERYTVEAVIGQGGMAVVYRVRHNALGSLHALKILTVPKPNIRERLLAEGRAQAVIRHPNVVSVTDVLEIEGSPALLMEYVEGPTLEAYLESTELPLSIAEEWFRGICAGVGEAHAHGMVHRDLKPSNVLLAPRSPSDPSQGYLPKVTDFGIAKVLAGDEPEKKTRTNVAMGTPHYMAPEQIRDAKSVDQRADVFSLGCLLYEMVCGVRPFDGNDVLMVLNAVASGRFAPARSHVPNLPDRVVRAIDGALVTDRNARIQSCAALLAVLGGGEPTDARQPASAVPAPPPIPPASSAPDTVPPDTYTAPDLPGIHSQPTAPDVGTETPARPIDPNARTVPHTQRTEGPNVTAERAAAARRTWAIAVGTFVLVCVGGGFGLFAYLQERRQPVASGPTEDGSVLGITTDVPPPPLEIVPPPPEPLPEGASPDDPATPGVRVDPNRPSPAPATSPRNPTASPVPGAESAPGKPGLGLFGPKDSGPISGRGRVLLTGDVKSALYVHGLHGSALSERDLPPGKYDVKAAFPGQDAKVALEFDLYAGETLRIDCSTAWKVCQAIRQ